MSFLKISDPVKREQIVKDYFATRKRIRDSQLAERMGEIELQTGLSKFFKPITETQKASAKEITEGLKPIKEGIEKLPKELPHQLPQLIPKEEEEEEEVGYSLLDLKYKELKDEYEGHIDKTFGIRRKGINYYIGDKMVDYDGDYIWVGAEKYPATDELWDLIMSKNPRKYSHSDDDYKNHDKILRDLMLFFVITIQTTALEAVVDLNTKKLLALFIVRSKQKEKEKLEMELPLSHPTQMHY